MARTTEAMNRDKLLAELRPAWEELERIRATYYSCGLGDAHNRVVSLLMLNVPTILRALADAGQGVSDG